MHPKLKNKKSYGRGLRNSNTGGHSHASTNQLRKILNWLTTNKKGCLSHIAKGTGIDPYDVRDGITFLLNVKLIEKTKFQDGGTKYYKLTERSWPVIKS